MMDRIHRLWGWLNVNPWVLGVVVGVLAYAFLLRRLRRAHLEVKKLRKDFEDRRATTSTLMGQIVKDFSRLRRGVKNLDERLRDVEVQHVEIIRWTEANITETGPGPRKTMPFPWGQRRTLLPHQPLDLPKDTLTDEEEAEPKTPREGTRKS